MQAWLVTDDRCAMTTLSTSDMLLGVAGGRRVSLMRCRRTQVGGCQGSLRAVVVASCMSVQNGCAGKAARAC